MVNDSSNEAVLNYEWKWNKDSLKKNSVMKSTDAFHYKNEKLFRTKLKIGAFMSGRNFCQVFKLTLLTHSR